jgi:hypothetical protein
VRYDRDDVAGLVGVDGVGRLLLLELGEDLSDRLATGSDLVVALGEDTAETVLAGFLDRLVLVELVTATEEGSGSRVGEELLLEVVGGDDGDGGGTGEVVEELLDFAELELRAVLDPLLLHEAVVLLVEVDQRQLLLRHAVEETALLGEVDDLEGLENLGKLSGGDVGVDVEDLTLSGLSEGGEDGESAGADGSLGENTTGDGAGAGAERLEGVDELEVLGEENAAGVGKGAGVGDTDACA